VIHIVDLVTCHCDNRGPVVQGLGDPCLVEVLFALLVVQNWQVALLHHATDVVVVCFREFTRSSAAAQVGGVAVCRHVQATAVDVASASRTVDQCSVILGSPIKSRCAVISIRVALQVALVLFWLVIRILIWVVLDIPLLAGVLPDGHAHFSIPGLIEYGAVVLSF
jgi:hypothetical protein